MLLLLHTKLKYLSSALQISFLKVVASQTVENYYQQVLYVHNYYLIGHPICVKSSSIKLLPPIMVPWMAANYPLGLVYHIWSLGTFLARS